MKTRGWTLVELLVVMAVVTILLGIAYPYFRRARRKAIHAMVVECARGLLFKEHAYFVDSGRYAGPDELVRSGFTPSCVLSCDRIQSGGDRLECWKGRTRWVLEVIGSQPRTEGIRLRVWRTGSPYAAEVWIDPTGEWVEPAQPLP